MPGKKWVVSLDALEAKVRDCRIDLLALLDVAETPSTAWVSQVVSRLEETALPIVTRDQPLAAETATAIRLAALCLGAEADAVKGMPHVSEAVGDTFREIAAGITLLERRANGQAPVTETIILATA